MRKVLLLAAATIATMGVVNAEFKPLDAATEGRIAVVLNENLPANLGIGKVAVDSAMIDVENSKLKLDMNAAYGYVPELAGYNAMVKSKVAMMFERRSDSWRSACRASVFRRRLFLRPQVGEGSVCLRPRQDASPQERSRRQGYCHVAEPWLLFRAEIESLGVAARPHLPDRRRSLHTEFCNAVSHADA